ncbi:MAG: glycosyltransferase family 2 protein [Candidatus Rokuibacteriota bacterium]
MTATTEVILPEVTLAEVTLIVVPRERFGMTRRSLESIYANTDPPFTLIYVDGRSPAATRRYLAAQAKERGFRLIRTERYLTPNEARNLGIAQASTPYVVFVDNDVLVTPGWLEALVRCARETGAWVVGPLYCMGEIEQQTVHMTGGHAHIFEQDGARRFREDHRFWGNPLPQVRPRLRRESCEMVEFHCMLVGSHVFQRLGPLDEGLKSALENPDFCMSVRQAGGEIYFEPAALITYLPPPPLAWSDLLFFLRRWSNAWNRASLRRFQEKWHLPGDDPNLTRQFTLWTRWRRQALVPPDSLLARALESRVGPSLARSLSWIEGPLNRWFVHDRPGKGAARQD